MEIECIAVTEYSTVWQFTGTIYSNRTGFASADYVGAIDLTDAELQYFRDTCDDAYTTQEQIFGDPRWEDMLGNCDGKAAYVALDLSVLDPDTVAYYRGMNTDLAGFDCLVIGSSRLPERRTDVSRKEAEDGFAGVLIHELNHYIVAGCIGHEDERWSMWTGEAFAQAAIYTVRPENTVYLDYRGNITNNSSRLRLIPGMLWSYDASNAYLCFDQMPYTLGPYFLRYIERETTGQADGRLWTEYFAQQTPGNILGTELDGYLKKTTGEGLEPWMARFMAAVLVGADNGPYCMGEETITAEYRVDPYVFFRPCEEYGTNLSFDGAADEAVIAFISGHFGSSAVEGGGTTYAWRNDAGGRIAVTGADDRWYFFAVTMELPGERQVIDIGSPEELAKIGSDKAYPLSGRYRLTTDIDLEGGPDNPWTPIGTEKEPFTGEFDGSGHTIRGLYVNSAKADYQGLFGMISGNRSIRDLTVYGSVTGCKFVGGIAGWVDYAAVRGCESFVTVTGEDVGGGVVGLCGYSTVSECRNAGAVTAESNVGGVVGVLSGDNALANCCHTGTVTSSVNQHVGGLAGDGWNGVITVENSYSYQPDLPVVGDEFEGTVTGCYVRSDTKRGEGFLTTAQFASPASFPGWDFKTVWSLENGVRPVLRENMEDVKPAPKPGGGGGAAANPVTVPAASASSHGKVTASAANARAGDKVTLTVTPDEGYTLDQLTVTDAKGNEVPVTENADGTYSFTMPATAVTVTPEFEETTTPDNPENPDAPGGDVSDRFTDVGKTAWYHDAVQWAVDKGLMNGVCEDKFAPNDPCTRAMVVTMLWRLAGEPEASAPAPFTDVKDGAWYADAVAWAAESGAVNGTSDTTFSPNTPVTREQLATILYRYAQAQGKGFEGAWMFLLDYPDAADVSDWANEAMHWMVMHGVITGMGDGTLAPQDNATRAQIATMFMRFVAEMEK